MYETYRLQAEDWLCLETADLWVSHANHTDYLEALNRKKKTQFFAVDFLHLRDWELLTRSLDAVDIAFFGGTPDMKGDLAQIAKARSALIVLTLGVQGSVAFHGDRVFRQVALPLEKVVDTTGCDDAFQAGFTDAFYRERNVPSALAAGAREGRIAAAFPRRDGVAGNFEIKSSIDHGGVIGRGASIFHCCGVGQSYSRSSSPEWSCPRNGLPSRRNAFSRQ